MKAFKFFAAVLIAVLTLSLSAQAQNKKKAPKYEEVTFSAHIHCNNCKAKTGMINFLMI